MKKKVCICIDILSMFDKRQAILERGLDNVGYNGVTKEGIKLAEKYVQKNALSLPAESYDALAFAEKTLSWFAIH